MAVTAAMVKELRGMTGAGMMDCKKALTATDGDMDKAIEFLREKGLAGAQKKAGRIAAEGIVDTLVAEDGKSAVIVEVNAETDFVAKNEKFRDYVKEVAKQALTTSAADMDAFFAEPWIGDSSLTVKEQLSSMISIIGENMNIRRFKQVKEENGVIVSYIHAGGKIGVLVGFDTEIDPANAEFVEYGTDVAMQIAALNTQYLDEAAVPAEVIAHEKEIMIAQMKQDPKMANKPEQVLAKIVEGKVGKFYKENCLVDQEFVKDSSLTIKTYTAAVAKKLGGAITITKFVRFEKGEGIEKRQDDFAAEVASMVN